MVAAPLEKSPRYLWGGSTAKYLDKTTVPGDN